MEIARELTIVSRKCDNFRATLAERRVYYRDVSIVTGTGSLLDRKLNYAGSRAGTFIDERVRFANRYN